MSRIEDVVVAAEVLAVLGRRNDDHPAWAVTAEPTTWSAARVVEHIGDALLFYAGQVARRADRRLPVLRDGRGGPPSELLDTAVTAAHVLAAQLRDLGAGRAWHPSGTADAAGWAGMAVTELLVHGYDAAQALALPLDLPAEVCSRTMSRVFPWVDRTADTPTQLLLAVTGRVRVPDVPYDPDWWWQSAPLDEWDGEPRRRDVKPGWT